MLPEIIGEFIFVKVSTFTKIVKIGSTGIFTLIVTVMRELSGIKGNPVILTPLEA